MNEAGSEGETLLGGDVGRGFTADTVADGINVLGGSFERFIDDDARIFEFDFGVVETEVDVGFTASSKDDVGDANHFLGVAVAEDDVPTDVVLADGDDFARVEDGGTEFAGEIIGESGANFGIFTGENALVHVEEDDFGAELGVVGGDFTTGGASTDDGDDFGEMADFDGGLRGEEIGGIETCDLGGFEMSAGSEDEITCGEFFGLDGDGVRVEEISEAVETNDAGFFDGLAIVATGGDDGTELAGNEGWHIERKIVTTDFGERAKLGESVGKIESDSIGNVEDIEIGATEKVVLDEGDGFLGFG